MAKVVLTDASVFHGPLDLSGSANQVSMNGAREVVNVTNFASGGWEESVPGMRSASGNVSGFLSDAADPDASLHSNVTGFPFTVTKTNPAGVEDVAYAMKVHRTSYAPTFNVGEAYGFSADIVADSSMVRGQILCNATVSSTGSTLGFEAGAVSAAQSAYAGLHVTSAGATSLAVTIQSDDNSGFTSATTRFTFTTATGTTSQWLTPVSGAITDSHWRAGFTQVGGGSWTFVCFLGIQ